MNQIALTICDRERAIHKLAPEDLAVHVVAALSADPETLDELWAAMRRFRNLDLQRNVCDGWDPGPAPASESVGFCVVDLEAELIACQSRTYHPDQIGSVCYHDGTRVTDLWLRYHLSDRWQITDAIADWHTQAAHRRAERQQIPRLDVRRLLYDAVLDFVVHECRALRDSGAPDPLVEIHRRWLMTPREDARGATPRELLVAEMRHIDWDLGDREIQWGQTGQCPPGLATSAAAFRHGGIGTHEWVLYYELVRFLLAECWQQLGNSDQVDPQAERARLAQLQQDWLNGSAEEYHGYSPADVIDRERQRLPLAISGEAVMVDDDCPLCQMMAEQMSPCFWHLDGCNMEDEFAFSPYPTRDEWDEMNRRFEQWSQAPEPSSESHGDSAGRARPTTWAAASQLDGPHRAGATCDEDGSDEPIEVRMFAVGAGLTELISRLKWMTGTQDLVNTLNRGFSNLRDVAWNQPALLEPVADRLRDELAAVADAWPDLQADCADVEQRVGQLLRALRLATHTEDGGPRDTT